MTRTGALRPTRVDDAEPAGPSRRTVLKAGAWAAPVIAVAAAVPAASASVLQKLRFTNFSVWFLWGTVGDRTGITGNAGVILDGEPGAAAGPPVTLVITVPAVGMSTSATVESGSTGWTASNPGQVTADGSIQYRFIWAGALTVNAATSQLNFRLPAETGVNLAPPIAWSAVAIGPPAESIGAAGTLQSYTRPTADSDDLAVEHGVLSGDGTLLTWTGASITYEGGGSADVPYVVELHGPSGIITSFTELGATIADGTTVTLERTFDATELAGGPFVPGQYWVSLSVIATDAVIEARTTDFTVTS